MLQLLTFGGLRVTRGDRALPELANQRRRLAVLAVVAASPDGVSRDRLLGLLWPEAETERGRHALAQLVYNLRRDLGTSPIEGKAELRLVPDVMRTDLGEFRAAIARGDHSAAATLYSGPFLDGFFVPDAGEFERWTEEERRRLAWQAFGALEALARTADAAGDLDALVRWTGRLSDLEPLSARHALAHMRALVRRGDRESALAYGQRYSALAAADLGGDADAAVGQELERLRALTSAVTSSDPAEPLAAARQRSDAVDPGAPIRATNSPDAGTPAPPAPRRWRLVAAAIVLLSVGVGVARQHQSPPLPMQPGDRLLVADALLPPADSANVRAITIALESALRQSARVNLLGPGLVRESLKRMGREADSGRVSERTAIELAEREGARYVLVLSVVPAGTTSRLTLRALAPGTGELVIAHRATTSRADLLAGIDELVSQLRHDFGDARSEIGRAVPLPRVMTASLEALTLYARGRDAYNRGKYNDARILYTLALDLDSSFATAHAALGGVEAFTNHPVAAEEQFTRALGLAAQLPPRERLLLDAEVARGRGDWVRAAALHSAYLQRYPDDYDIHASLGYDQMRADNPAAALVAYDSARAHGALTAGGWINIAAAHSMQGDDAAARRAYAAAFHRDTALLLNVIPNEEYGATLLRLGFADSARAAFRLLLSQAPPNRVRAHRSLAYVDLYEGRYPSAIKHLQLGIALATADSSIPLTQARDRVLLANTWLEVGQAGAALQQVRAAARLCLTRPFEARMLLGAGKTAVRLGDVALARVLADSIRARARAANKLDQAALAGLEAELLVAAGHAAEGVAAARRAVEKGDHAVVLETLAHALNAAGQREEAWITYEALRDQLPRSLGREGQQSARLAPLSLALMAAEAGRTAEARTRLDDFLAQWPDADADLTLLRELRRRLAQAPK